MPTSSRFRLRVRGPTGLRIHALQLGHTRIGNDPAAELFIDDRRVSARHAEIVCTAEECTITDVGSANGTYVDGTRLPTRASFTLRAGETVAIGSHELILDDETWLLPVVELESGGSLDTPLPATITRSGRSYPYEREIPPGLLGTSARLMQFMPSIYQPRQVLGAHTNGQRPLAPMADGNFLSRFLALCESVLLPVEWVIDNFDLYLDPRTTPMEFLPWLESWYSLVHDSSWSEKQRRVMVANAHWLFARRGTRVGLRRVLAIYTCHLPRIDDQSTAPHTFHVQIRIDPGRRNRHLVENLIDRFKPAHTTYTLSIDD